MKARIVLAEGHMRTEVLVALDKLGYVEGTHILPGKMQDAMELVVYHRYSKITATMSEYHNSDKNEIVYFCEKGE